MRVRPLSKGMRSLARRVLLTTALLAGAAVLAADSDELALRISGRALTARFSPSGILGADVRLNRTAQGLRGQAFGRAVDLGLEADRAVGLFGEASVQLFVKPWGEGGFEARGPFGDALSNFRVDDAKLSGRLGVCSYELKADGGGYSGFRRCEQGGLVPASVQLPAGLRARPVAEQAAILALFLSQ